MSSPDCQRVRVSCGMNVDRLSSLPDSVLVRILSFLPPRDAVRTVLNRSFGNLWTMIDTLDFVDVPFIEGCSDFASSATHYLRFIHFVRWFLLLHKRSKILKFRVQFSMTLPSLASMFSGYISDLQEWKLVNEVQMWVMFALARGVEVLDLGFSVTWGYYSPGGKLFELPHSVWTSGTLVELSLLNCEIGSPKRVQMNLLRTLKLNRVRMNDVLFSRILRACPLLQNLTVTDCSALNELSVTSPNVETLRVNMERERWKLIINCPNVRSFHFYGFVEFVELVNLSALKIVSLNLKMAWYDEEFIGFLQFKRFLERTQHAEVLKLNNEAFAVFTYRVAKNHPAPRNNWKRVILNTKLNSKYIPGICGLLRNSSDLEELIINIRDPLGAFCKVLGLWFDDSGYAEANSWSSECLITNLKIVNVHGLLNCSFVSLLELLKVILKNALVLEKICIFIEGNAQLQGKNASAFRDLFDISKKLLEFPKASKQAKILLM